MLRLALFASATSGVFAAVTELGKVTVLTKDNFKDFMGENEAGALVEYYAPWCGHCKKLEPEFNKAAEALKEADVKIPLAKVDATVEKELAEEQEVRGYPTLKYFVGGKPTEYDGPREADGIVSWIKAMSGPAVTEGTPDEKDTLSVTLYGDKLEEAFEAVAKLNRKKGKWYYTATGSAKIVLKHLGEPAIEYEGEMNEDKITEFFKGSNFPLYGDLNGDTFSQYIESGAGLIWTLLPMTADNHKEKVEESREVMTKVAKKVDPTKFKVTHTNTNEFGKVLENMFGVKEFPAVIVQKKAGDQKQKFIYKGEIDEDKIVQFVEDVVAGKVEAVLKSEEPVTDQKPEDVYVVVGKTMKEDVFTADKDVLLEVYAPWCGHCKKLEPEYKKVAKKVAKEGFTDILRIAKLDGTENDSPIEAISWSGFPTMYYIKAGSETPEKYEGPRDAKGIWKWIKKNHSQASVITDKLAAKKKAKDEKKDEKEEKKDDKKEEL